MERASAGIHADCIRNLAIRGKLFLECGDLLAEHELRRVQHSCDGGIDLPAQLTILGLDIEERDCVHICFLSSSLLDPVELPSSGANVALKGRDRSTEDHAKTAREQSSPTCRLMDIGQEKSLKGSAPASVNEVLQEVPPCDVAEA